MRVSLVFGLVAFALAACAAPATDGPENRGHTESAIVGGSTSPATQDATVLVNEDGTGICSGTLIASNLVLTARHCVSYWDDRTDCGTITSTTSVSRLSISVGANASGASSVARVTKLYVPDSNELCSSDIALLALDSDVQGITPTKVSFASPTQNSTGTAVGYGAERRTQRADVKILAVGPSKYTYSARDAYFVMDPLASEIVSSEAICAGDSGGPLLDSAGRVFAVASRSPDEQCRDRPGFWTTLDGHEQLIRDTAAAVGHPIVDVQPGTAKPAVGTKGPTAATDDDDDEDSSASRGAKKKKTSDDDDSADGDTASGGCATTPGGQAESTFVMLGLVLTVVAVRRKRSAA